MNILAMDIAEKRSKVEMTVLYRKGGAWHQSEVGKLVSNLKTVASTHPKHPEYVILYKSYTKEATLEAIGGGQAYTATKIVGMDSKELPFTPKFI